MEPSLRDSDIFWAFKEPAGFGANRARACRALDLFIAGSALSPGLRCAMSRIYINLCAWANLGFLKSPRALVRFRPGLWAYVVRAQPQARAHGHGPRPVPAIMLIKNHLCTNFGYRVLWILSGFLCNRPRAFLQACAFEPGRVRVPALGCIIQFLKRLQY